MIYMVVTRADKWPFFATTRHHTLAVAVQELAEVRPNEYGALLNSSGHIIVASVPANVSRLQKRYWVIDDKASKNVRDRVTNAFDFMASTGVVELYFTKGEGIKLDSFDGQPDERKEA